MRAPRIVEREEWLAARRQLLEREKDLTRAGDSLARERRALPAVRVSAAYTFTGPAGGRSLVELFEGRRQLIVAHLMFAPGAARACPGCALLADAIGNRAHLHARDTTLVAVSRAPYPDLAAFAARMGWTFPWFSSAGSAFNYDFHVSLDPAVAPVEWNYRSADQLRRAGLGAIAAAAELPGISVFLDAGDQGILHTYSAYGRGLEPLLGTYSWLDLTPMGRGEGWDGQPDLGGLGTSWVRLHDEYPCVPSPHLGA